MNENDVPSFLFLFVLLSFFFLCRCCTYICPLLLILAPTARLLHAYRLSSEEEEYTTDETSDEEEEGETTRPSSSSGRKSSKPPRRWQASEDRRLAESVKLHGEANWKAIASKVGSRNHVQCLQRWKKVRDTPGMFLASFWGGVTKSILFHTGCSMPLGILYFGRIIFWEIFFFFALFSIAGIVGINFYDIPVPGSIFDTWYGSSIFVWLVLVLVVPVRCFPCIATWHTWQETGDKIDARGCL